MRRDGDQWRIPGSTSRSRSASTFLIGLERERIKGLDPTRRPAGIHNFALATLLGAIAVYLGQISLLMVAACKAALTGLSHLGDRGDDPGLTIEVALLAAPLIGGLAISSLPSGLRARRRSRNRSRSKVCTPAREGRSLGRQGEPWHCSADRHAGDLATAS